MAFRVKKSSSKLKSVKKLKSSLPSSALKKRNQGGKTPILQDGGDRGLGDAFDDELDDLGIVPALPHHARRTDVLGLIEYIRSTTFDDFPTEKSGLTAARRSEIERVRGQLPPILRTAHIHALLDAPTHVEREAGRLLGEGVLRKVMVPGRGFGASDLSESITLTEDWVKIMRESELPENLQDKYISIIQSNSHDCENPWESLAREDVNQLMQAGFLILDHTSSAAPDVELSTHHAYSGQHDTRPDSIPSASAIEGRGEKLQPTLPRVGPFLHLIEESRRHLLYLLGRSKRGEAPAYLLRERWDGGITSKSTYGLSKDPFALELPAKRPKWRNFYGMSFDWVLAECLGAGLIEAFDTGTVGLGIRKLQ